VELARIQIRARNFSIHSLEGHVASVDTVIKGLNDYSWVHLACHAVQNTVEPMKSPLCLHDGSSELSTIITKEFPHADSDFASLSPNRHGTREAF
jgi:CHAT domain-containing protein